MSDSSLYQNPIGYIEQTITEGTIIHSRQTTSYPPLLLQPVDEEKLLVNQKQPKHSIPEGNRTQPSSTNTTITSPSVASTTDTFSSIMSTSSTPKLKENQASEDTTASPQNKKTSSINENSIPWDQWINFTP